MQVKSGAATVLLLAIAFCVGLHTVEAGNPRARVRTACQGSTLKLSCPPGYRIHILAAFYGRASGRICPSVLGHSRRKRPCAAKGVVGRVRRECENRPSCHVPAISSVFGNPCHHQRKYLRVRYACAFRECKRVVKLQAKMLRLIARYANLATTSYGYWRRRHFLHRRHQLEKKLNKVRRKFHSCFKCKRGCVHLRELLTRLKRAIVRVKELVKKIASKRQNKRWHASRRLLKRKLSYLKMRQRVVKRRLRKCLRVCHY